MICLKWHKHMVRLAIAVIHLLFIWILLGYEDQLMYPDSDIWIAGMQ